MSLLLRNWLISDLNTRLDLNLSIEHQFSTGYRFGKLLEKLGVEDEGCKKYVNSDAVDALIINFCGLEQSLREKLHVKLSPQAALDIISQKPGAAQKLLYEIKSVISSSSKKCISKTTTKSCPYDSYPSSPVDGQPETELFNPRPIEILPALPFDNLAANHFETVLQKNLKRKNAYVQKSKPAIAVKVKKPLPPIPKFTAKPVSNQTAVDDRQPVLQKEIKAAVRRPETYKVTSSIQDLQALEAVIPQKQVKKQVNLRSQKLALQLSKFEARLPKSGTSVSSDDLIDIPVEEIRNYSFQNNDLESDIESMRKRLAEPLESSKRESELYIQKLKSQKLHLEVLRRERELVRKSIMLNQSKIQQEQEEKAVEDVLLQSLLRQSLQERRIAEQLLNVRHEKEIIKQNRIYRDQQYAAAREKEYQEALEREVKAHAEAKKLFTVNFDRVKEQHFEILEKARDEKHLKNLNWVRNRLVEPLIELALKIGDYQDINGVQVPFKKMREWKMIFANEMSLSDHKELPMEINVIPTVPKETSTVEINNEILPQSVMLLDDVEFKDYIHFKGYWENTKADKLIENNAPLGNILDDLMNCNKPEEKKAALASIPTTPLRIILLGKKYSGKRTLAGFIAENYCMNIIQIDDLIKDAISQADLSFPRKKDKSEKETKKLTKQQIGARLQYCLTDGQAPDDTLLVQLIIDAMNIEVLPKNFGGWLLLDFPQTRNQAILLEKELSGYEESKPVKKGELKRKEKDSISRSRNRSMVAGVDTPDLQKLAPASGVDAVLFLDVPSEVAIFRAVGQLVEIETAVSMHIETNTNSIIVPGTTEKLAPFETVGDAAQLQYQIAAFQAQEEVLKQWFQKFKILKVMDAAQTPEAIQNDVQDLLNQLIDFINIASISEDKTLENLENGEINAKPRPSTGFWNRSVNSESTDGAIDTALTDNSRTKNLALKAKTINNFPTKEFAQVLVDQWVTLETAYTSSLKFCFRALRRVEEESLGHFYETKVDFKKFLHRPDIEQELVDNFQREFNMIDDEFRSDPDVKAELHLRAEELMEKLWDVADRRREEVEGERIAIIEDRWIEDQSYILANLTITMIQAEADRFLQTRQFVIDYFREIHGFAIPGLAQTKFKVPFVGANDSPPIDVSTILIALSEAALQKRKDETISRIGKPETASSTKKPKAEKLKEKKGGDKSKYSSSDKQALNSTAEVPKLDLNNSNFPDISSNIDLLLDFISVQKTALNQAIEGKKTGNYGDSEIKFAKDFLHIIDIEEQMLFQRIDRLKDRSIEILKEIRGKSIFLFNLMDENIGSVYKSEVDSAKMLAMIIKDCIESERKLSNQIIIDNEKLLIDFSNLVVEPKAAPRPISPQEDISGPEIFTADQLKNIGDDLSQLYPTGTTTTKAMGEYFAKLTVFASGLHSLPDAFMSLSPTKIKSIFDSLDPYQSGFTNWKKFLVLAARILPVDLAELEYLKQSYKSDAVNEEQFMKIPLWFEKNPGAQGNYKRIQKLKSRIFSNTSARSPSYEGQTPILNTQEFLLLLCLDNSPIISLEKAFTMSQDNSLGCTREQAYKIFTALSFFPKYSNRAEVNPLDSIYPPAVLEKIFDGTERLNWSTFVNLLKIHGCSDWLNCRLYTITDIAPNKN